MKIKYLITTACIICTLLCFSNVWAQCSKGPRPEWATSFFRETLQNSRLETIRITGTSERDVREKFREEVRLRQLQVVGEPTAWIRATPGGEYWVECGPNRYVAYMLVQTRHNPDERHRLEELAITDHYPLSFRVFVPGMAQIHKGSKGKGAIFIAAQAATIGGIVVAEVMRASYESKINPQLSNSDRQFYIEQASNMQNIRNICIAAAVAVYAWNVIDGIVARGRPHILVDGRALSFVPYIAPQIGNNFASGISLTFNF